MINMQILQFYALFPLPLSDLQSNDSFLDCREKRPYMKQKLRVFNRDSTNMDVIAYLNVGGESVHKTAQFIC